MVWEERKSSAYLACALHCWAAVSSSDNMFLWNMPWVLAVSAGALLRLQFLFVGMTWRSTGNVRDKEIMIACQVLVDCWPGIFQQGIFWVQTNFLGYKTLSFLKCLNVKSGMSLCMSFSRHWQNYIYFQQTNLCQKLLDNFYMAYLFILYILVLDCCITCLFGFESSVIKTHLPEGNWKREMWRDMLSISDNWFSGKSAVLMPLCQELSRGRCATSLVQQVLFPMHYLTTWALGGALLLLGSVVRELNGILI